MLTADALVLVTVTFCALLVVAVTWTANASAEGESLSTGAVATPCPVRLTICGLPVALSVNVMVPGRVPVPPGVKVTCKVHVPFGCNVVTQGFEARA